jgi:hypothetical protein
MGIRAHIERRKADSQVVPILERRGGVEQQATPEPRIPEWKRRATEQRDRLGYVAVSDLTTRLAA